MRRIAPCLAVLLLTVPACSHDPDPARMVAQIFEETRAESEALFHAYGAANEDPDFSGQVTDLPGWKRYVELVRSAAAKRLAEGVALGEDGSRYGGFAANVALNTLRYEWLPERQLVRVWGDLERKARDPEYGDYVRVVQDEAGEWRLASWPPTSLEALFSERSRFPHRLSLTLAWWPAGEAPADAADPWFQLEHRGEILWDARMPKEERLRRSREFLRDVALPRSRLGEQHESLDGVLVRAPGSAPVAMLLEVLAHLSEREHRIPDVQLWVTGADFPEYFQLNQRGAWGEEKEVVPLWFEQGTTVAGAIRTPASSKLLQEQAIAFALPWTGPAPDPLAFLEAREAELMPLVEPNLQERAKRSEGNPSIASAADDPAFQELCARAAERLTPHLAADLPFLSPASARKALHLPSMALGLKVLGDDVGSGRGWLLQGRTEGTDGSYARIAFREPVTAMMSILPVVFLRLEGGEWKFCSWIRHEWPEVESRFAHVPPAPPFVPSPGWREIRLKASDAGVMLDAGYQSRMEAKDPAALMAAYEQWANDGFADSMFTVRRDSDEGSSPLTLSADQSAPQWALWPLLHMMQREDCELTELRLQVLLDDLGRPGELIFDQRLTRPGADASGSVGVPLDAGQTIQQLCDLVDGLIEGGAMRFHLLPPQ